MFMFTVDTKRCVRDQMRVKLHAGVGFSLIITCSYYCEIRFYCAIVGKFSWGKMYILTEWIDGMFGMFLGVAAFLVF